MMLRVPCVAVIVKNSDDKVLLNLRDNKPGIAFPNHWTLPGGRIESNETPHQAARRELHEETGLDLSLYFWKVYDRAYPAQDLVVEQHVFVGGIDDINPRLIVGEGQALQFFDQHAILSLQVAFGFEDLLTEFLTAWEVRRNS